MKREEIIRNLKYTLEKHKNDNVNTFGTNISVMCKDILDYLEQDSCKRKKGNWIDIGSLSCRCSNCGCKNIRETDYCPNCGADMRGKENE